MPIPKAMTAPVYGGSVAPPVSSAPDVPSQQANEYRDPVDDINRSYEQLQEGLTDEDGVLGTVQSSTSAPSEVGGGGADAGCAVWDWLCDTADAFAWAAEQVAGVVVGVVEVFVETVVGLAGMAWDIVECLIPWSDACAENVNGVLGFLDALIHDPLAVLDAMWNGITQPIKDDWNNGDYGEAVGRGFASLAEVVAGAKGVSKIRAGGGRQGSPNTNDEASPATNAGRAAQQAARAPNATLGSLRGLNPGNSLTGPQAAAVAKMSDEELLASVNNPLDGAYVGVNNAKDTILNGNHRIAEMLRRAGDPAHPLITDDLPIYVINW